MTLRVVSETDPVAVAWAAYDTAMLRLQAKYRSPDFTSEAMAERMKLALEARNLWRTFINLYDTPDRPRPAA